MHARTMLGGLGLLFLAGPLGAQQAPRDRGREPTVRREIIINGERVEPDEIESIDVRREGDGERRVTIRARPRGRLGVLVNMRAVANDSLGATIDGVTPGSPAARAGLRSGDVITRIDGQSLTSGKTERHAAEDESLPGLRLVELMAKTKPGQGVSVEFARGAERRSVTVETDAGDRLMEWTAPPGAMGFAFGDRPGRVPVPPLAMFDRDDIRRNVIVELRGPLGDHEFAAVNPDLGRYFGISEGVLVVAAPATSSLNLRGGDVILNVDGRKPSTPGHLARIFRSYERGETVKLEVQRDRKKVTLTGKLGEERRRRDDDRGV